jgi:hypothetical protein
VIATSMAALTRRPLPERDEAIEALDPETRGLLGDIWAERAKSELGAGSGFAIVVTELYALGADPLVLRLATKAAHDEVRHAELCRLLAEAYRGAPVVMPRPKRVGMPVHEGADETLRMHLHVLGLCCINETIAAGFVEACLEAATAELVRAIQREHLADEVEHARVGWAHFASSVVDDTTRDALAGWAPKLVSVNRRLWHERIATLPEDGVPAHGYPPRARLIRSVDETIRDVVLPGLRHVGIAIDTSRSRRWVG